MKGLKKGLAMLLVLVACLALTTMAFAAEYTVRPGSSIRVSLTQSGNGGIDGNVTVSGGASVTYTSSEAGGVTSGGKFYLYNSGAKTVTAMVGAPSGAKIGDVYTVTFTYNAYDADGNDSGTQTVVKTVTVGDKDSSPDGIGGGTGVVDTTELEKKIQEAKDLNPNDYSKERWDALQDALTKAEEALNSKKQSDIDAALKELTEALNAMQKIDYTALDKALADANAMGGDNKVNSLWLALADALKRADEVRRTGDQAAVDALADEINGLLEQLLANTANGESCNIGSHKVWPILFFVSFAVNLVLTFVIVKNVNRRKRNRKDSTPLVDYDISDDE